MARSRRTYRQFSWNFFLIHLFLIAGIALLLFQTHRFPTLTLPLLLAIAIYLAWSTGVRALILTHHQRGMKFFRQKHYQGAIRAFEESIQYLNAHPWIDKYRWIVLLSTSDISYREMAMYNIGSAYAALGNAKAAGKALEAFLKVFPASPLATPVRRALATLEASKKKK